MKTLECSTLSDLSNDKSRLFVLKLLILVLLLIFVGIGKAFSQDCKDPLGYGWYFEQSPETGWKYIAYLTYNPDVNRPYEKKERVVLDSVYLNSEMKNFNFSTSIGENVISKIYFCTKGEEIFLYSSEKIKRNQKNWPEVQEIVSNFYGKKVGNTIYVREEIKKQSNGKKWFLPIFSISLLIVLFAFGLKEKISYMKNWGYIQFIDSFQELFFYLFIVQIAVTLLDDNFIGAIVYGSIYLFLVIINLVIWFSYIYLKKKHQEEIEKQRKNSNS